MFIWDLLWEENIVNGPTSNGETIGKTFIIDPLFVPGKAI